MNQSIATALTDPAFARVMERLKQRKENPEAYEAQRARVVIAALSWVYDQTCSNALAELEASVEDLTGIPLDGGENESSRPRT